MIDFNIFCSNDKTWLSTPFFNSEHAYYTDGTILIRVVHKTKNSKSFPPKNVKQIRISPTHKGEWHDFSCGDIECIKCNRYEQDTAYPNFIPYIQIYGIKIGLTVFDKIIQLPRLKIYSPVMDGQIFLKFKNGIGIAMSIRN